MKKISLSLLLVIMLLRVSPAKADEGMWIPMLLSDHPESEMKRLGMRITAADLYNINQPSLKDAVVMFAGVCTGEIISDQGLLLTNHHCGFNFIQAQSSVAMDYLTNGFWAKNRQEELPCPGLSVVLLNRMEDVTDRVLKGVSPGMNETDRQALIDKNARLIEKEATKGPHSIAKVKAFYYGNQFFLIVSDEFSDVRLVGAPPNRIGDFGGETDNWMWPRHTGDFSLFRIYADADNKPAAYTNTNVPYHPRTSLTISLKGVKENDFTLLFGFPGKTQEYLPSYALELLYNTEDPAAARLREHRLEVMEKYMAMNRVTRLQYSGKHVTVANGWKKMFGEMTGIRRLGTIERRKQDETTFQQWADGDAKRKAIYGNVLTQFRALYARYQPLRLAYIYYKEAGQGVEILPYACKFKLLVEAFKGDSLTAEKQARLLDEYRQNAHTFFRNYNLQLDKETFEVLMGLYLKGPAPENIPGLLRQQFQANGNDIAKYAGVLFSTSELVSEKKVNTLLTGFSAATLSRLEQDPVYQLACNIHDFYTTQLEGQLNALEQEIQVQQRLYMKGLMEMSPQRRFYPDANSTLRVSYGTVQGYEIRDGVYNRFFTTLDGVMQKEDTLMPDYMVDAKLKSLWKNKDYGRYADADGRMHVCFLATNHTTGGNSGSPILNADGQLVGLHFDRVWEGTMSDIYYDPDQCRNIAIDIRYILFLIEKYAGAGHLIGELRIVE